MDSLVGLFSMNFYIVLYLIFLEFSEMLYLRWNSQFGAVFVDGSHMQHNLELGDEIKIDGNAPILRLFD